MLFWAVWLLQWMISFVLYHRWLKSSLDRAPSWEKLKALDRAGLFPRLVGSLCHQTEPKDLYDRATTDALHVQALLVHPGFGEIVVCFLGLCLWLCVFFGGEWTLLLFSWVICSFSWWGAIGAVVFKALVWNVIFVVRSGILLSQANVILVGALWVSFTLTYVKTADDNLLPALPFSILIASSPLPKMFVIYGYGSKMGT